MNDTTTTTPEPTTTDDTAARAELRALGELIRAHQLEQGHTDAAFLRLYPALGKDRSYKRIHTGEGIHELRAADWIAPYRSVWELLESNGAVNLAPEVIFDDLSGPRALKAAWLRLVHIRGIQRVVLIQGDTGSGKTCTLMSLLDRVGGGCRYLQANECWSRPRHALEEIGIGLGIDPAEAKSTSQWLRAVVGNLQGRGRVILLIDEIHHVGGEVLNLLKDLINRTSCGLVLAGQKTLVEKLLAAKRQEARQLIVNRLLTKITLGAPTDADATTYLSRRLKIAPDRLDTAAVSHVVAHSKSNGHFSFVRRVGDYLETLPAAAPRDAEAISQGVAKALADLGVR